MPAREGKAEVWLSLVQSGTVLPDRVQPSPGLAQFILVNQFSLARTSFASVSSSLAWFRLGSDRKRSRQPSLTSTSSFVVAGEG